MTTGHLPSDDDFRDAYLDAVRAVLRQVRHARGLMLKEVASQTGISETTLSRLETGHRGPLRLADFVRICASLDVHPCAVLDHAEARCAPEGAPWTRELPPDLGTAPGLRGQSRATQTLLAERDRSIVADHRDGLTCRQIAAQHALSPQSVYRILSRDDPK